MGTFAIWRRKGARRLTEPEWCWRAALSAVPDPIVLVDETGTILLASDQVRDLLGCPPEDLVGRAAADVLGADWARVVEGRPPESQEVVVRRADGTERLVEVSVSVVEGPGGQVAGAAVLRSAGPDGAGDAERLLAQVAGSTSEAVLTVDLSGWITSWNAAAEQLYGWTAREAMGRHISFLVPRDRHEEAALTLARARAGEGVGAYATVRLRRGGTPVDVSVAEGPIRNRSGRVIGVSSISRDITEERAARQSLSRYAAELERSRRDLEEYATITAHDLSEPLRVVGGYAGLLQARYGQGKALDEAALRYIDSIAESVERMRQLIERVLSFSQLRAEHTEHGPVELTAVLDDVRARLAPLLEASRAEFFPADLPAVWGDRAQLTVLFENLVSNACRFGHPDRPTRIVVSATPRDGEWAVSVSDNGIGIEPAYQARIFEMFRRLHADDTAAGAGIGLTLCRQIVNLHGGEIGVESAPGQGAVFSFTLPACPAETAADCPGRVSAAVAS
jgi:PAS domain S-box-containing protein